MISVAAHGGWWWSMTCQWQLPDDTGGQPMTVTNGWWPHQWSVACDDDHWWSVGGDAQSSRLMWMVIKTLFRVTMSLVFFPQLNFCIMIMLRKIQNLSNCVKSKKNESYVLHFSWIKCIRILLLYLNYSKILF